LQLTSDLQTKTQEWDNGALPVQQPQSDVRSTAQLAEQQTRTPLRSDLTRAPSFHPDERNKTAQQRMRTDSRQDSGQPCLEFGRPEPGQNNVNNAELLVGAARNSGKFADVS
jgi:hypothetical protein